ncbi:hypothetical protein NDU88_011951 [Pleurodeles waltl]|uniref:Uncharacterized protein n=1 Tax=Pleurodeles waltl TaxID=8319 RepID=A0AAV7S2R5_PLEWA|nr:hypothetical protein NDU88_011951 [Pleurodeles waltl]
MCPHARTLADGRWALGAGALAVAAASEMRRTVDVPLMPEAMLYVEYYWAGEKPRGVRGSGFGSAASPPKGRSPQNTAGAWETSRGVGRISADEQASCGALARKTVLPPLWPEPLQKDTPALLEPCGD